jgi:hypothetical protein
MESAALREGIRSGAIQCQCALELRGFVVVAQTEDGPFILYDRKRVLEHFKRCPWAAAVAQIYRLERVSG